VTSDPHRPNTDDDIRIRLEAIEVYLDRMTGGMAGRELNTIREDLLLGSLDPDEAMKDDAP
jgi:hypothetical protein